MPIHLPALPSWSTTKTTSKQGFDKVYSLVDKLGAPVNKLSNKLGSEAFWPTTLDKESDKAARILRSFCKDGFYVEEDDHSYQDGKPKGKQKVIKKIPTEVIKRAKGLAIFTTMRTGLWISGAGGSGVLVGRKEDGEWSSPSGILLHTAGLGFLVGVDIYDCVVVINTAKALEAFTKIRCTLGGEVSAVAGPVGMGGILETELHKRQAPVFNYLKSRGFYAGVQVDGTVLIERGDENEKFYGERVKVADILAGRVRHVPYECRTLLATIKAAQGDEIDENQLPAAEPTPGDFEVAEDHVSGFGLPPSDDDPDPFGVKALEQEGMEIKEIKDTGAVSRPSSDAFEYRPSPSSPIFANFSNSKRLSKRDSGRLSISNSIASTDRGTQTADVLDSPRLTDSPKEERNHSPVKKTTENLAGEVDDGEAGLNLENNDEPALETPVISKAKLVTIPRRIPPALPPRSPYRTSGPKPGSFEPPLSPLSNEHPVDGLGINVTGPSDVHGNQTSDGLYMSSFQDTALEEKLNEVHLAPRQDPERLSSRNDGFDEVSLSGSDYSRGTPAETPLPKEDPMHVETPKAVEESAQAETPIKMEDIESSGGLKVETWKKNEVVAKAAVHEHDEFHSVPSTPLDAAPPVLST